MTDNQELVPATGPLDVPAVVDSASRALDDAAERGDVGAVKVIYDQAQALEGLVKEMLKHNKKASDNLRKLNELVKLRIASAQQMGSLLMQIVQRGGSRYRGATLQKAGVSRNQSSKFQRVAKLSDMTDAYIESCNFHEEEASLAGYMRFARNQPHFSSESDEWYTPQHVVQAVQEALGSIHTDPCSNAGDEPNVPAEVHYTEADDGLKQEWKGTVFMNPPYGRVLINWVRKLQSEIKDGRVTAAIALLPARPGSDWFKEIADHTVCFLQRRLRFSEGNPAPFPSMCVYLGADTTKFIQVFRPLGCLFQPVKSEGAS